MDPHHMLDAARVGISETAPRVAALIRSVPDTAVPVAGLDWAVQELAAHLVVVTGIFEEQSTGVPSPVLYPDRYPEVMAVRHADIAETDSRKLADLVSAAADRYLDRIAARAGDQFVDRWGTPGVLGGSAAAVLGELVLHGYDLACSLGQPWPIDPDQARMIIESYLPLFHTIVDRRYTADLTAGFRVDERGGGSAVIRFTDGVYSLEDADSGPVDCILSVDPVAFLLVGTGRLSAWTAVALGLISAGGENPAIAASFPKCFVPI